MNTQTLSLPVCCSAGSLEQYIHSVNSIDLLSAQEERELAERLRSDDDLDAARTLVMSHLRLVVAIARGYLGYGLPHADLIQEGNIGLMKAVKRFDPSRGVRLVSFAIYWIKAEIHEYVIRNWRLVKIATTKAQRKLFFNLRSLKKGFSALDPDETREIAQTLGVKPEEVREMESRFHGQEIALEHHGSDDGEDELPSAPIQWLADHDTEPTAVLERQQRQHLQHAGLDTALQTLDARSQDIVRRRWLHDETESATTLHELAAEYGVSAERIRQIETRALQKMRLALS